MPKTDASSSIEEVPTTGIHTIPDGLPSPSSENEMPLSSEQTAARPFRVYMTLQGKGGCGKSLATYLAVQYLESLGRMPVVIDADPVNKTLEAFRGVRAEPYDVVSMGEIDPRQFDGLVERVLATPNDFVIDNGAATFVPLSSYMSLNGVPDLLAEHGRELVINSIVVGGESQAETFLALESLAESFPTVKLVCWVNEYFGPVGGSIPFEETTTFKRVKSRLWGLVRLERLPEATFGRDFRKMMTEHMTFDEAIRDTGYMIMEKQRLAMIRRNIFAQISKANM